MKNTLSVVISAYNEESKIVECLESVKFADEIIFIDNESQDKTQEIAKKYTKHVFVRPNNPMLNINKNYGISKTSGDWILVLDADERITPELAWEIGSLVHQHNSEKESETEKSEINGYYIPRKNIIFGKWIEHTGWYPDYQLRLIKKGKGKFPEKHVHEMIEVEGQTGNLKEDLMHYNYENISQFIYKLLNIYVPNEANELIRKGYQLKWTDAIQFPAKEFLSRFFAREGYKDGFHGLMLSLLMAFYHLTVFAFIWEKEKFKETDRDNILQLTEKEVKKVNQDLAFWFTNERLKTAKNGLEKVKLKVRRKFRIL